MLVPAFEHSRHRNEVIGAILSGVVPVKYTYAGSATIPHSLLAEHLPDTELSYRASHEIDALGLACSSWPQQIADIGPSTGDHSREFLHRYCMAVNVAPRYIALDFSANILKLAEAKLADQMLSNVSTAAWDVEAGGTSAIRRWRLPGPVLLCLLGNTIGNVGDPVAVLQNIKHSADPGDILLVSAALAVPQLTRDEKLLPYRSEAFHDMITAPLVAIGIPPSAFRLIMDVDQDAIVGRVSIVRDVEMSPNARIEAGSTVQVFLSRRHSVNDLVNLTEAAGWSLLAKQTSPDHSQVSITLLR